MRKQDRKQSQKAADVLAEELRAKAKRIDIAREVLPEETVDDPVAVQRFFRGNRRKAKWNRPKKRP